MLSIHDVHKDFATTFTGMAGKKEVEQAEVLKGITLSIDPGTVTAILGTNGSGKSTLFNVISGLLPPSKGTVTYHHQGRAYYLHRIPAYQHARIGIARLFQGSNVFDHLTVLENMYIADDNSYGESFWQLLSGLKKQEARREAAAAAILHDLLGPGNPLWEKRNEAAGSLSLGQQRLLAFARLLMNKQASLYLLDEPCAGVNPTIRKTMIQMIRRLREGGKTVVLIEHNLDFVAACCETACYMEEGKVLYHEAVAAILARSELRENYLGEKKTSDID